MDAYLKQTSLQISTIIFIQLYINCDEKPIDFLINKFYMCEKYE